MNARLQGLRRDFLESKRKVDIERALIITEVYRNNEEKPQIVKRAMALEAILSQMTLALREGELIVGNQTKSIRGVPLFPENAIDWIMAQMDTFPTRQGDQFEISEDDKQKLREVLPYWEGKTLRAKIKGGLPPFLKKILQDGLITNENFTMSGPGHMVPDYGVVMRRGLKDIKKECQKRAKALKPEDPDYVDKYSLYHACAITCDALMKFALRYAKEATRQAQQVSEVKRREELTRIAEICHHVPSEPSRNFWEALQCIYFLQVALQIETNGLAIALGRLDQILYPYYQQDLAKGILTRDEAMELIQCFYLKVGQIDKIYTNEATRYLQGPGHGQTITLGGVTKDGKDATNELSYLFLEADRDVRLVQPDLAVRVHNTTPEDFLQAACHNIQNALTKPKLMNDEVIIQSLLNLGVPLEDARDWGALGCSEPVMLGKTNSWGDSGHLSLPKCVELALNDGKCMITGRQMGPHTGDPTRFATFDEFLNAFRSQVEYFVEALVLYDNIIDKMHMDVAPLVLYSLVTQNCLEKGVEFNKGGAKYNYSSPLGVGPITAGDSLAAVKKVVFEDKLLSMEELREALLCNFEGKEDIRQMLINRAPKFGNDDDLVDDLCNEVLRTYCDKLRKHKNLRNGPFIGALYHLTANVAFGRFAAASADGRKRGEPFNDGGVSPVHGRDKKGATAVAKSIGKLDIQYAPHGSILNQRFHASLFQDGDKAKLFRQYIRTFMELGGWHTQFNIIGSETLRAAQQKPDEYQDLVIRVAGYSAYFTQLEKELQDDIIERTEQVAY